MATSASPLIRLAAAFLILVAIVRPTSADCGPVASCGPDEFCAIFHERPLACGYYHEDSAITGDIDGFKTRCWKSTQKNMFFNLGETRVGKTPVTFVIPRDWIGTPGHGTSSEGCLADEECNPRGYCNCKTPNFTREGPGRCEYDSTVYEMRLKKMSALSVHALTEYDRALARFILNILEKRDKAPPPSITSGTPIHK